MTGASYRPSAPVGSLTTVAGLLVTDVFGERLLVQPAGRGTDEAWQNWRMFVLDTRAAGDVVEPRLFLPPATPKADGGRDAGEGGLPPRRDGQHGVGGGGDRPFRPRPRG